MSITKFWQFLLFHLGAVSRGQEWLDRTVVLDYRRLKDVTLTECRILYSGGRFSIEGCHFDRSRFVFSGSATNTVNLLQSMNECGARDVVRLAFPRFERGTAPTAEENNHRSF